ncbi:5'-3' exonuclease [Microbacterium sp. zg.Y1090]|uniref:5'-3' exonuclease n=1 Tax=Microbacterium TaxID=33882 RepID=UPI00214C00AD|nr:MULTISPECIES: 5'-3' exonuclease [unclassified Microbacterium]MCR2811467.1 5'-3' exonuclease [Microbacterium sp. zg.Y1084]MCR2819114.1 5'-3' exonuclease [Microbacterium sp. zg.Y1090]MDL5487887.1 5'-3' exonuclease [Microbacterium sp. zg-Y1211]WIM27417.1 5'-3' exonuclease [Microbacterium sp. zg-Y1090]
MTDRLMLLDTASLYFRAFYGVPDKVRSPDGTPINAVRGLLDMIAKLTTTYDPTDMVACWDDDWRPQWRVDLIPTYKTHRVAETVTGAPDVEQVPDPLEAQIPVIRDALALLGIPVVGLADHEADDVIGTLATRATMPVDIVTGDRDLFQLVDDARGVRVIYTARGMSNLEVVTDATVVTKYRILPTQYADYATLRGDASDGLPGVAGIGEKTAATLLAAHGDLEGIRAAAAASEGMSATVASRILAAADYLDVAPTVVKVVTDLAIAAPASRLRAPDAAAREAAQAFAERWGLGTSMTRALDALATRG